MTTHVTLRVEKETPGTIRYEEIDSSNQPVPRNAAVIGKLYIRKHALPTPPPARIRLTLEVGS